MIFKYFTLTTLSLLTLSACTASNVSTEKAVSMSQITYEHLSAIPINVSKINITSATQRGARAWDIANNMITPPDTAMRRYLGERFKANTSHGTLNVHLAKADVIKSDAPNENKILSYLSLANEEDYMMEIVVDLESKYLSGQPDNKVSKRFVRKVRMPLNVTMAYREAKLQRTLEEMIRDIDEGVISTLTNQLGLISSRNVPVYAIDVKTIVPKTQTKIGVMANDVNESLREVKQSIGEQFENKASESSVVKDTVIDIEKATSIEPVQITQPEKQSNAAKTVE